MGTSEPMARTCGGTTSIGDGSSEHCESHSGKGRRETEKLVKLKIHSSLALSELQ
jgi:hypothetical protein